MIEGARGLGLGAVACLLAAFAAPDAPAQTIARAVEAAREGTVRLSFAARPGVHGDGRSIRWSDSSDEWRSDCGCGGPVRVALSLRDSRVEDVRTYVGGSWRASDRPITDLGAVPAAEAADYLLDLVPRLEEADEAEDAILAAALADSAVVWPRLLQFARDRSLAREVRKRAVFWVGQAAARAATAGLESLVETGSEDQEVREHAIFALSQRPDDEGVPALIRIVRTNPDPALKRKALFWLGQSEDPRVIALFEEILTRN